MSEDKQEQKESIQDSAFISSTCPFTDVAGVCCNVSPLNIYRKRRRRQEALQLDRASFLTMSLLLMRFKRHGMSIKTASSARRRHSPPPSTSVYVRKAGRKQDQHFQSDPSI